MPFDGSKLLTSFKKEVLEGLHNFKSTGGNEFKLALFKETLEGAELGGFNGAAVDETIQYYNSGNPGQGGLGNSVNGGGTATMVSEATPRDAISNTLGIGGGPEDTGYTAGGNVLTSNGVTLTNTNPVTVATSGSNTGEQILTFEQSKSVVIDFDDLTFSNVTIEARGALIYNNSQVIQDGFQNLALYAKHPGVCILDFGSNRRVTRGDFTVVFPTANINNAVVRII